MNLQQHNISDNNFEQCIKCTVCTVYCPFTRPPCIQHLR